MKILFCLSAVFMLAGCVTPTPPQIVSQSPAGITLRGDKLFPMGGNILKRDQVMANEAAQHCSSKGKSSVLTLSDTDDPDWVTYTYECR